MYVHTHAHTHTHTHTHIDICSYINIYQCIYTCTRKLGGVDEWHMRVVLTICRDTASKMRIVNEFSNDDGDDDDDDDDDVYHHHHIHHQLMSVFYAGMDWMV
ncbi:Hypothetical predicted protein [Octopus vulgaris]|uniref:Uncharacterized protein n=1 Tax=Octopus vulgaris TaxID=6645 RepID=A0AA36F839_OCTVU|nr:Hypothetical predicted protein [Octopus vulgaris]